MLVGRLSLALLVGLAALTAGCQRSLMATPNLFKLEDEADPFAKVPEALRSPLAEVIYVTDRKREDDGSGEIEYGSSRSREIAFGITTVKMGNNLTWEQLAAQSRGEHRPEPIWLSLAGIRELGRFPESPYALELVDGKVVRDADVSALRDAAMKGLQDLVAGKLKGTPRKEVFLLVHGYNNDFEDPALVLAQIWHFMGREGVPVMYSWPAGSGGLLRGYTTDRESGEFTVFHLKETLRALFATPGLERVHIIAHSRGTDVVTSALREIHLAGGGASIPGRTATLGTLILAAPDLDAEVISQRIVSEGLIYLPTRIVVYVSSGDSALGISAWLFRSGKRLGTLRSADLSAARKESLSRFSHLEIIDAEVSGYSTAGHDYYYSHPAVSSDLLLVLKEGREAGAEHGRPLQKSKDGFWTIDNDYPKFKPGEKR